MVAASVSVPQAITGRGCRPARGEKKRGIASPQGGRRTAAPSLEKYQALVGGLADASDVDVEGQGLDAARIDEGPHRAGDAAIERVHGEGQRQLRAQCRTRRIVPFSKNSFPPAEYPSRDFGQQAEDVRKRDFAASLIIAGYAGGRKDGEGDRYCPR